MHLRDEQISGAACLPCEPASEFDSRGFLLEVVEVGNTLRDRSWIRGFAATREEFEGPVVPSSRHADPSYRARLLSDVHSVRKSLGVNVGPTGHGHQVDGGGRPPKETLTTNATKQVDFTSDAILNMFFTVKTSIFFHTMTVTTPHPQL